jgi:hypothetical protein
LAGLNFGEQVSGDYATLFWVNQQTRDGGCALLRVDALLFISITNLQKDKTMIASYKVEEGETKLIKLDMKLGKLFIVPSFGTDIRQRGIQFSTESGAMGGIMNARIFDADKSRAVEAETELLDEQLGEKYISYKDTIRGWGIFQYPDSKLIVPGNSEVLTITDQIGRTFKYTIPLNVTDSKEELPRVITPGAITDLTACEINFSGGS